MIKLVSIELTNQCSKQCYFCYNESSRKGRTSWSVDELVKFIQNLSANGVEAVSFGGGEPLEYIDLFQLLHETNGMLFRSMTSNGLLLDKQNNFERLVNATPDKIHISIHFPENKNEVIRVKRQVIDIASTGILSGINLLIRNDNIFEARLASEYLQAEGITKDQIVYLPMRMKNPVSREAVSFVANETYFQSISCLKECGVSERFCSISWDKKIGWCSYTTSKSYLEKLDYNSVIENLRILNLAYCG